MNEHIGKWKTQEVNLLITMKYNYAKRYDLQQVCMT